MKLTGILAISCILSLSLCDSMVNAQRPGGRAGQGGGLDRGGEGRRPMGRQDERPGGRPGDQQMPPLFRIFDTNNDGEVSSSEIDAAASALRKLDSNQDGKISVEEMRPSRPGPGGPGAGGPQGRSGQSRDGQQRPGRQNPMGGQGQRGGRPSGESRGNGSGNGSRNGGGGRGGDPAKADAEFAKEVMTFDENADGRLAMSELPEHMHAAFNKADVNRDGSLDQAERLILASQFRRNALNPTGDSPVNTPTQGRRPNDR